MDAKDHIRKTREFIEKERGFLFREIGKMKGLEPYSSVANFLLVRIEKSNMSASSLTKKLLKRGILIRDCSNFRSLSNKFIRIAVRSHKENLYLLKHLKEALDGPCHGKADY